LLFEFLATALFLYFANSSSKAFFSLENRALAPSSALRASHCATSFLRSLSYSRRASSPWQNITRARFSTNALCVPFPDITARSSVAIDAPGEIGIQDEHIPVGIIHSPQMADDFIHILDQVCLEDPDLGDQENLVTLVQRTSLEQIHLSYCENVTIPANHFLLQLLYWLTHLSLVSVPEFRRTAENERSFFGTCI
jgi:hypothetical protein